MTSTIIKYVFVSVFVVFMHQVKPQTRLNMQKQQQTIGDVTNVKALIFGISNYKNLPIEKQLEYADDDAVSFYQFLLNRPDIINPGQITALFNNEASGQNKIRTMLYDALVRNSQKGDLIIIYFTGHGDVQKFSNGKEEAFLLFNNVQRHSDYLAPGNDALSVRDLQHYISLAPEGVRVLLISDACRSGKILDGTRETSLFLSAMASEWERTIKLVSCQPNQLSYENKKWGGGHGVFSYYLMWALRGIADQNKDHALQLYEIYDFVKKHVQQETNYEQIPKVLGDETLTIFPVDAGMKNKALKNFAPKSSDQSALHTSSILFDWSSKGAKSYGPNYFYGLSAASQFKLLRFQKSINNSKLLPGDVHKAVEPRNLKISERQKLHLPHYAIHSMALSPDGSKVAVGGKNEHVNVYDLSSKNLLYQYPHKGVLELQYSNDGRYLFTGGWDNRIKIWDLENHAAVFNAAVSSNDVRTFAFANQHSLMAAAGDGKEIKLFNTAHQKASSKLPGLHKGRITSLVFGPEDKILYTAGKDGYILKRFLNTDQVEKIKMNAAVNALRFYQPDSLILSVDDKGRMSKIDPASFQVLSQHKVSDYSLEHLAGSSLTNVIYTAGKAHRIYGFDMAQNTVVTDIAVPRGVNDLQLNAQKNLLVASDWGNQVTTIQFQKAFTEKKTDAWEQYQILIKDPAYKHLNQRIKNYYGNALQDVAINVIGSFIENGVTLPTMQEIERARACLEFVKEISPNDAFMLNRAETNLKLLNIFETLQIESYARLPDAVRQLKTIINNQKDAAYTHNTLSALYQKLYKLNKAKKSASIAASRIPDWVAPKINMGKVYFSRGKYAQSMHKYREVIELEPKNYKGYLHLAKVYAFLGRTDSAMIFTEKACRLMPQSSKVFALASEIAIKADRLAKADELLHTAIEMDTVDALVYYKMANLFLYKLRHFNIQTGKVNFHYLEQAFYYMKMAEEQNLQAHHHSLLKGNIYLTAFKLSKHIADDLCERLYETCKVKSAHKLRYLSFHHFDEVYEQNPLNYKAVWGLAQIKALTGNIQKACWYTDQLAQLMPGSPLPSYLKGRTLLLSGKEKAGQKSLMYAIKKDRFYFPAYLHLFRSEYFKNTKDWPLRWTESKHNNDIEKLRKKAEKQFNSPLLETDRLRKLNVIPYLP